jgi:hypothetical protein
MFTHHLHSLCHNLIIELLKSIIWLLARQLGHLHSQQRIKGKQAQAVVEPVLENPVEAETSLNHSSLHSKHQAHIKKLEHVSQLVLIATPNLQHASCQSDVGEPANQGLGYKLRRWAGARTYMANMGKGRTCLESMVIVCMSWKSTIYPRSHTTRARE